MTDTIIYSTDPNDNNKNQDNLTMIDYLASEGYLQGDTLETAQELIKAFRQQKSLSSSIDYEKLFVDGGKQDPQWEVIIQSNRKWSEFEALLKKQAGFIEKYLCIEKTIGQYEKELGKLKLIEVISKLVLIIEKLTRLKDNDLNYGIKELKKKVYNYGFRKVSRELHINPYSLKKAINTQIFDTNNTVKLNMSLIIKLIKFFE